MISMTLSFNIIKYKFRVGDLPDLNGYIKCVSLFEDLRLPGSICQNENSLFIWYIDSVGETFSLFVNFRTSS